MSDDLGRLVKAAALAPRAAAAKARFLAALAPAPTARPWPLAAAALFLVGITLATVLRRPEPPSPAAPDQRPASQDPAWAVVTPLGPDGTISLRARLPAPRAKTPFLRLEGTADLPDRFVLMMTLHREEERYDGRRLTPSSVLVHGGLVRILRGRYEDEMPWRLSGMFSVRAALEEHNQGPEARDALKSGKYPVREWSFRGAGWGSAWLDGLAPALDDLGAASADLLSLLKEFETACATEERWRREAPRLKPIAHALRERLERISARSPLPGAAHGLLYAARNLDGDNTYFAWEKGAFQGPVSYHADRQKPKTFRGDPWTFESLRRYAEEAPAVGGREAALWIIKDLRRGGRPEIDALAKRAGVAPYAERLRAGTALDALEEDVRSGR